MSRMTTTVLLLACDLCFTRKSPEAPDTGWATLEGRVNGGGAFVNGHSADVCPACVASFKAWQSSRIPVPPPSEPDLDQVYGIGEDALGQLVYARPIYPRQET